MRPDPRVGALTAVRRRNWGPWWLWTIVVILAAGGAYAGHRVRSASQMLAQAEEARALLAANRQELQSGRVEIERQLESARAAETALKADLDRVRAEGNAVSAIVGKLQKQVASLEADLKGARAAAEKAVEEAASAKARLEERLTTLKAEADEGRQAVERLTGEMARAAEVKAALEREIAGLKDELGKVRAQPAPEGTGATPSAP
jgi:chromosome segregation ATPase